MKDQILYKLREEALNLNKGLFKYGLAMFTWGNASVINRQLGLIAIKPSGVPYEELKMQDMVLLDMKGEVAEGSLNPSSDTDTHIVIYNSFDKINSVIHTHSHWATIWAQAGKEIPALGTTHADHFYGDIPCTRMLTPDEINKNYEKNTGEVIVETFADTNPEHMPAVLVNNHGPFCWGINSAEALYHAVVLEEVSRMAYHTLQIKDTPQIGQALLNKHFLRKHGNNAYYGQEGISGS